MASALNANSYKLQVNHIAPHRPKLSVFCPAVQQPSGQLAQSGHINLHQSPATPNSPARRDKLVTAASMGLSPSQSWASFSVPEEQQQPSFMELIVQLFRGEPQQTEDEEWRRAFGQYLNDEEEAHGKHGMYTSHLAERMALEPPSRRT